MGAEAIRDLLAELDIEKELKDLKNELKELSESNYKSGQKVVKIIKRVEVFEAFKHSGNKPEWMIMTVLPVIPPGIKTYGSIRWWTICNK